MSWSEGRQCNARPTSRAEHRNGFLDISPGRPKREPVFWASSLTFCMTQVMQKEGRQKVCQVLFLRPEKALRAREERKEWFRAGRARLWDFLCACFVVIFCILHLFLCFSMSFIFCVLGCFRAGSSLCVLLFLLFY